MIADVAELLRVHGIQPSTQRIVIADYVLGALHHPAADDVFAAAHARLPVLSRATVYNTLHLLVAKGLLRECVLAEGRQVYDANVGPHHHFIDDDTGEIHDVPWDALRVENVEHLSAFDVRDYQVVLRGRRSAARQSRTPPPTESSSKGTQPC